MGWFLHFFQSSSPLFDVANPTDGSQLNMLLVQYAIFSLKKMKPDCETGTPNLKPACEQDFSQAPLFTQKIGTWLSSELGKVNAVRKRSGAPPQLHHCWYRLALSPLLTDKLLRKTTYMTETPI